MFTPLTSVSRPHHHARGFDQARDRDRAEKSKLIRALHATKPTSECNKSATKLVPINNKKSGAACGSDARRDVGGKGNIDQRMTRPPARRRLCVTFGTYDTVKRGQHVVSDVKSCV